MNKAIFIKEIEVEGTMIEVYQHQNGGLFAIDSSFLEAITDCDEYPVVSDMFNPSETIMLTPESNPFNI